MLVAPARNGHHDHLFGPELFASECRQRVCRFERRDDSFESGQFECGIYGLPICDGQHFGAVRGGQVCVQRSDSRIVQPR